MDRDDNNDTDPKKSASKYTQPSHIDDKTLWILSIVTRLVVDKIVGSDGRASGCPAR